MEMILLFFCLTSVVITSVIVAIEIRGDKSLSRQSYKGEMNTINFHGQQILAKDKNTNEQLRNRVFETLDQQLNQLGYVAKEPQLQFINNTLNSEHTELEELTPNELKMTFSAILQARESNEIAARFRIPTQETTISHQYFDQGIVSCALHIFATYL